MPQVQAKFTPSSFFAPRRSSHIPHYNGSAVALRALSQLRGIGPVRPRATSDGPRQGRTAGTFRSFRIWSQVARPMAVWVRQSPHLILGPRPLEGTDRTGGSCSWRSCGGHIGDASSERHLHRKMPRPGLALLGLRVPNTQEQVWHAQRPIDGTGGSNTSSIDWAACGRVPRPRLDDDQPPWLRGQRISSAKDICAVSKHEGE